MIRALLALVLLTGCQPQTPPPSVAASAQSNDKYQILTDDDSAKLQSRVNALFRQQRCELMGPVAATGDTAAYMNGGRRYVLIATVRCPG